VLAGVLRPDAGAVHRHHGSCKLLALETGFMPNLSGRENAVLSGLLQGMERREVVSRLELIKTFSELGDFFEQPVKTYSSGMRARLGFSIAIQQQPDILLIDETLAVGDAAFRQKSLDALRDRLVKGATVVLVSHSENTIKEACDRALWLDKGRIRAVGAPSEVMAQYGSGGR
jgi:lipopolysaccharide transport system ATP-binding protein